MKKLTLTLVIMSTVFTLAFAGGGADKSGPVTITMWTEQTQSERMAEFQLLIDAFQALNPGVTVKLSAVDINDFTTQLTAAVAANTTPNIITASTQFLMAYDEDGLTDNAANQSVLDELGTNRFFDGTLALSKSVRSGGYFMVPYHFMIQGIWYRKDWFDKAGLAPPNTKDSILKAAKYFYQPKKNQYGILVGTKSGEQYNEQVFLQIAIAHNAYLFQKDGTLNIDSPEMIEALEYYKELSQYTPPGPQTWRGRDYYFQNKLAMFFYSTFIMDDLALQEVAASSLTTENFKDLEGSEFDKNLVVNTGMEPIITWDSPSGYAEIGALSILKSEDQAKTEASKALIKFLFEKDNYLSWVHLVPGGFFPVLKEVAKSPEFLEDPKGVYKRYGTEKILKLISGVNSAKSFLIRDGQVYPQASTVASKLIIPEMLNKITIGNVPIDKAVADAKRQIEELLQ